MLNIFTQSKYLLFLGVCGLLEQGCNIINPVESTPTYIHIDSFQFSRNPSVPSSTLSHKINTIWVYYNNNLTGVFDLPATFPVMANGTGKLEISPGVIENGRNDLNIVYPYYQIDTSLSFTASRGGIINYTPKTTFYSATKITKISDFENGKTFFTMTEGDAPIISVPDSSIDGAAGVITLKAVGDSSIDGSTLPPFPITYNAPSGIYIEFDYKTTIPFYVGLQANLSYYIQATPYYLAGISPNDHWQKFYLNVSDFENKYQGTSYNFYIKAVLGDGQTSGKLLIDNIQLVTF